MKRFTRIAVATALLATASAPASAFLANWKLNLDGGAIGNAVTVSEYLDFVGNSFIQNTFTSLTNFNFTDQGTFQITSVNGGALISTLFPGYEMTATFTGGTGTGTLGGPITFTGGTLKFYSGTPADYGTSNGIYGADNGVLIGTFALTTGTGLVDPITALPNGILSLAFQATSLTPGYWLSSTGTDLSANPSVLGFVTTNATRLQAASQSTLTEEIVCQLNGFNCPSGVPFDSVPFNFLVSNNGQFRLNVPEPGTVALLGLALLGLGASRIRRSKGA